MLNGAHSDSTDESISGIPMGPVDPTGIPWEMGSTAVVLWECEKACEWLGGNDRE